jgi:hypothetical protein
MEVRFHEDAERAGGPVNPTRVLPHVAANRPAFSKSCVPQQNEQVEVTISERSGVLCQLFVSLEADNKIW